MVLGARFMKRKTASRSLLFVLVAMAVIAFAIPALASPAPSLGTPSVFASFNSNIPGAFFLKHDSWGKKDKCGDKWNPCAVPEEPGWWQIACVLALFAIAIPGASLLRRRQQS